MATIEETLAEPALLVVAAVGLAGPVAAESQQRADLTSAQYPSLRSCSRRAVNTHGSQCAQPSPQPLRTSVSGARRIGTVFGQDILSSLLDVPIVALCPVYNPMPGPMAHPAPHLL